MTDNRNSICSGHRIRDPDCEQCNATVRDLLPDWDEKKAEAEAAGLVTCECGFKYYRTTDSCPSCGLKGTL